MECAESDCDRPAAVELHIPWTDNRLVCAAHARVLGRQDGVVADPLPNRGGHLLEREEEREREREHEHEDGQARHAERERDDDGSTSSP